MPADPVTIDRTLLRDRRREFGLTLEQVAAVAHITGTYLSHLERGTRHPSPKVAYRLAKVLELQPEELVVSMEVDR